MCVCVCVCVDVWGTCIERESEMIIYLPIYTYI